MCSYSYKQMHRTHQRTGGQPLSSRWRRDVTCFLDEFLAVVRLKAVKIGAIFFKGVSNCKYLPF